MKNIVKKLLLLLCCCLTLQLTSAGPKIVLTGDYADPSIICVDGVYYMTHSSFFYAPGLLIWKSTDLEHWTPVTYALQQYHGDVWAPERVYYMFQGPTGDWWIVYHGYDGSNRTLGRNILFEPVEWTSDGWLRVASPIQQARHEIKEGGVLERSDNFSGDKLGIQWQFWKAYEPERVKLQNQSLHLQGKGKNIGESSPLTVIAGHSRYEVSVERVHIGIEVSGYSTHTFGGFLALRPAIFCTGKGSAIFRNFRYEPFESVSQTTSGSVSIEQFGIHPTTGEDASGAVRDAIKYCADNKISKLLFPKGRYDFYPDKTYEDFMFVSNNNDGLKSVAFLLEDFNDFEIDGQGSDFIFHGYICPVILKNSSNIKFTDFSIDYFRTFHSEGIIKGVGENYIDVSFSEHYPYRIENERLKFYDNEVKRSEYPFGNLLEFDPVKKETAFKVSDYYIGNNIKAEKTDEDNIRVYVNKITGTVGNVMVFAPNHRNCPAITVHRSKNISFEGIKLYHSGGMGIISQLSENITINNLVSTTSPLWERVVGCTADVTHFSNCTGKISITNSLFENQMDDATNIHGIFMRIDEIINSNTLLLRLVHYEQLGMDIFSAGDVLEIVDANTVETYANGKVKSVKRLNKDLTVIEFEQPLSPLIKIHDVVGATVFPEVELKNCIIQKNRARGILLGSRERILIEGNLFHTSGASILTGGDTKYWFEQGGVNNLIIRNNVFDNCLFGRWGNAIIQLEAGSAKVENDTFLYNNNVIIENNVFKVFDPRILNVNSIDGLIFRNNKIMESTDYPSQNSESQPFTVKHSRNILINN